MSGLINRHPDPNRRPELMKSARKIKSLKGLQDGMRTGAIVCGALTIASGAIAGLLYNNLDISEEAFIPTIALGALAVVFTGVSITAHVGLKKKRQKFVDLYNQ